MERYNYRIALYEDIKAYIEDNGIEINAENADEWKESLRDSLWCEDSVTGNASGSYTFNAWTAEENLCHNLDLLQEACEEFGCGFDVLKSAEGADVTIRCYLLNEMINDVVDEMVEAV